MNRRASAAVLLAALLGLARPSAASDTACLYETLGAMSTHAVFFIAAGEADEAAALKGAGPLTLFAPTDAAFKKLDDGAVKEIATGTDAVKKLFRGHLATGRLTAADLKTLDGREVRTLGGTLLKVEVGKDDLRVGGAKVVASYECSNGVLHVIDAVLPAGKE